MQALKPMFLVMMLFSIIVFLYFGVPAGKVQGVVEGESVYVERRLPPARGRRGAGKFGVYITKVNLGNGRIITVSGKSASDDTSSVMLRRYFSILKQEYRYSLAE